jgi:DNA primase
MSRPPIDYGVIRERACFESILSRYGLKPNGFGEERMIRCPFHDDRTPSCSINLEKKLFHCFACGEAGTILDFVARMERCSIAEAARLLDKQSVSSAGASECSGKPREPREGSHRLTPNKPLSFDLTLDPDHPYLADRGLSRATIDKFGLGYCDSGIMKGRVAIPIHDDKARLIAYAGRWPGKSPPEGQNRYRFPMGFRKRSVLFNYHRVSGAKHLVIVEGFWSVFRLDALGIAAVALMGCTLSEEQEMLLSQARVSHVTLLLDGDDAGQAATPEIISRLTRYLFVNAPDLPIGVQPDTVEEDRLFTVIRPTIET